MPFEYQQAVVSLSDIDSENETFRITTNDRTDDLAFAMDRVGLTHPPILKPAANGYVVVCGFRRITAARSLGWSSISACILPEDVSPVSCALLAISENRIERTLNLIETSRALSLLASFITDGDKLLETADNLGLPGNKSLFKKIQSLCNLPLTLQEGILSGDLALPSAQMLSKLPSETSMALANFLINLKLSLHKQRELIGIVEEIAKRDDCSIESVLSSTEIRLILDDPELDIPRKAGQIRTYLKKRRFPHLTRAEAEFDSLSSTLKLGEHVSLKPPPGFESNRYTITLAFESLPEFETQRKALAQLPKKEAFTHLLSSRGPYGD